ncbi:MAG: DRTGG domain-containing protein [Clostridiales bacterium]|nr:DRTGG domain-containing protein [Clostridiales bacterium]
MEFSVAAGAKAFNKEVCGCYIGDLLSRVISRSKPSGAWITIMTNVNVAAVALLSDVACVILAEDVEPDPPLIERCDIEGIPLLRSKLDAYTIACGLKEII